MRQDIESLERELRESDFDFIPKGNHDLSGVVYPLVKSEFAKICDDTFRCRDNCSSGHDQPEWKHAVRRVLDEKKHDPSSRVKPDPKRGSWSFGARNQDRETNDANKKLHQSEYKIERRTRVIPRWFVDEVYEKYKAKCLLTGIKYTSLLQISHILSWSEFPDYRLESNNVLLLNPLHHRAFDCQIFTVDKNLRLRINPSYELGKTIMGTSLEGGKLVRFPFNTDELVEFLKVRNNSLDWI